jgi:Fe2+ transport system protein B
MATLYPFILGLLVMACGVGGLLFARFWTKTRDRLFALFAAAFWLLGVNWAVLALLASDEGTSGAYIIRLVAFGLILFGIIDKNRVVKGRG